MNDFVWRIRVYHEDSDASGIVYHTNYLKFMERARTEALRDKGVEHPQLKQEHNLVFVVRKISIDYLKPAFFNDLLNITVRVTKLGKASLVMAQQVLRESEILCQGTIKIGAISVVSQRPQPMPLDILQRLKS
jgi:acyl-CoA thioester hydrolase